MKALLNQNNLRLSAIAAVMMIVALQASVSQQALAAQVPPMSARPTNDLHAMNDAELGNVSAQGLTERALLQSGENVNAEKTGERKLIGKLNSSLSRGLNFLDGETTLTDVVYDPARAKSILNPDGSITQILPATIGEIHFDDIRVKGSAPGASFGSITIKAVEFNASKVTLAPRP